MKYRLLFTIVLIFLVPFSYAYANYPNIAVIHDDGTLLDPLNNVTIGAPYIKNVSKKFYETHNDDFDFLFVLTKASFGIVDTERLQDYLPDAFPLKKAPTGTGKSEPKYSPTDFGSSGRLMLVGDLFTLDNYTINPNELYRHYTVPYAIDESVFSQVAMVGRAFMKYWGGELKLPLTGVYDAYGIINSKGWWSFFFNSGSSVLGGNQFKNAGNGFTTSSTGRGFSELDQYLLGIRKSADVNQKLFYISDSTSDYTKNDAPNPDKGWISGGSIVNFTMSDIVSANGPITQIDKADYTCAFIVVIPQAATDYTSDILKADKLRLRFEQWIKEQTDNKITVDCHILGAGIDGDFDNETPLGCQNGQRRCKGNIVEICNDNRDWLFSEDCRNLRCEYGQCVGDSDGDQEQECYDGQKKCSENKMIAKECDSGKWVSKEFCSYNNQVCEYGVCINPPATDGDKDVPIADGDIVNPPIDGDTNTQSDGDEESKCKAHSDCPENNRCSNTGMCIPCPDGTELFDDICKPINKVDGDTSIPSVDGDTSTPVSPGNTDTSGDDENTLTSSACQSSALPNSSEMTILLLALFVLVVRKRRYES